MSTKATAKIYEPQRIKGIRVRDFMRLEVADIQIADEDRIIPVFGPNGSGKTSLAKAVVAAICGAKACPDNPVRQGAHKAEVEIEMTDHTVTWEHNGDKAKLHVTGAKQSAPQGALNALFGAQGNALALYPLRFLDAKPKEQADILRIITGVNVSGIETERFKADEARKPVNAEVSRLKGLVKSLTTFPDAPAEPKSLKEIRDRQKAAQAEQRTIDNARTQAEDAFRQTDQWTTRVDSLRGQLDEAIKEEQRCKEKRDALGLAFKAMKAPDLTSIEKELDSVEDINAKVAANATAAKAREDLVKAEVEADRLTAAMKDCDARKAAILKDAKMPVEGLSFDGDLVTFNGQPLSQASRREQLVVAASIGALHGSPRLRFGIIEEGSLFDRAGYELLDSVAEELDMQFLFEIVADLDKNGEVETHDRSGVVVNNGHASSVCKESLI